MVKKYIYKKPVSLDILQGSILFTTLIFLRIAAVVQTFALIIINYWCSTKKSQLQKAHKD